MSVGISYLRVFLNKSKAKKEYDSMLIHVCELCGYEYNPLLGDPDNGIGENTDFEELPSDWTCPLCGAGKEDFSEEVRDAEEEEEL